MSDESPEAFSGLRIGSLMAGYQLEEQIGRGGMAVVYRAYDPRLDRRVALKILAPGLALDEGFRKRFIRESRAAAAVDHPNIIPVFDAGEADGVLFIAMRLVRGGDVRALARAGPVPIPVIADIISQVASALDAAHLRGLVHRDVKPANMLLDLAGGGGRPDHVYLTDFGLSKPALAQTNLTSAGQFLGTLDYIAPEQVESRQIDGRADQYALASAAFELLCGATPFRPGPGLAVAMAKLSEPPPRPTDRRADLPPQTDDVIRRAMAIAPSERFRTCGEFAVALQAALGLAATPAPASPGPASPVPGSPVPGSPVPGSPRPAAPTVLGSVPSGDAPTLAGDGLPPGDALQRGVSAAPGRPWWRSRAAMSAAAALIVIGAGGAVFADLHGGGSPSDMAMVDVKTPACTSAVASAPAAHPASQAVTIGGHAIGVAVTPDGRYSFVTRINSVAVLADGGTSAPSQVASFDTPGAAEFEAVTSDGKYLLAAANSGAYVISVRSAEDGSPQAILGTLTSDGQGANDIAISADGRFAFITMGESGQVAVFDLHKSMADGYGRSGLVGMIGVGKVPTAVALSSDGRWLYVTSFGEALSAKANPVEGNLYVLSTRRAETDPGGSSVVSSAKAGCDPSGVIVSEDSGDVWVNAAKSDAVVAFSASKLITDPQRSMIARVGVGLEPTDMAFFRDGKEIIVVDSDSSHVPGADNLAVVGISQALAGADRGGLLGVVPAGPVPWAVALEPGGATALVTDYGSGQVEAIDTRSLP